MSQQCQCQAGTVKSMHVSCAWSFFAAHSKLRLAGSLLYWYCILQYCLTIVMNVRHERSCCAMLINTWSKRLATSKANVRRTCRCRVIRFCSCRLCTFIAGHMVSILGPSVPPTEEMKVTKSKLIVEYDLASGTTDEETIVSQQSTCDKAAELRRCLQTSCPRQ
jgi:hypothetical protein